MSSTQIIALVAAILLLVVLALGVWFIAVFTDNFSKPFATFFVKNGWKVFVSQSTGNVFSGKLDLQVKYIFRSDTGFSWDIVPAQNFMYKVDGQAMFFEDIESLKDCFSGVVVENGLQLNFTAVSLMSVLEQYHGQDIELGEIPNGDLFKLKIIGANEKDVIVIGFRLAEENIEIELDKSEVDFG